MTEDEEQAIRKALGDAIREPLPESVSILAAVEVLADLRNSAERMRSHCHARHMTAEKILKENDLLTYDPMEVH